MEVENRGRLVATLCANILQVSQAAAPAGKQLCKVISELQSWGKEKDFLVINVF